MASVGQDFQPSPCKDVDPSKIFTTRTRGSATIFWPSIFEAFSLYKFCLMVTFAATDLLSTTSAISNFSRSAASFNFSVEGTSYDCSSNVICMGQAHNFTGTEANGIQFGMLSLVTEVDYQIANGAGIAYYNMPVRLLDNATRQSASFVTSFIFYTRPRTTIGQGDGMTFVMSESNESRSQSTGRDLGIFQNGTTSFKTIVVEFDTYQNPDAPFYDISFNHVGIDFSNVTFAAAANPDVSLFNSSKIYAWVEYSNETQRLEVRVSDNDSRPIYPLLNRSADLFDVAAEYMWVGFSGGNSGSVDSWVSNYYVGDWNFESYGISPSSPAQKKADPHTGLIVGMSVAGGALVLATIFVALLVKRRSGIYRWQRFPKGDRMQVEGMPERFSYEELSVATRNFSEDSKLGQGGFGSVYRGMLPSSSAGAGVEVAVKKISSNSTQGEKEFMAEISIINQSRHRNLIQLRGWCKDAAKKQYLLVYELMTNGSLDKWLFRPAETENVCLSWPQRFTIVKGLALAVEYLHQGCARQVIHRDIKSSNIMLDENFNVKLGDFGLSRLVDREDAAPTTKILDRTLGYIAPGAPFDGKFTLITGTVLAGTPGYIAPEALISGKCTDKTDVYAFGVVVLEVACGRKVYAEHLPLEERVLVNWVWHRMCEGNLLTVVERRLSDYDPAGMEIMLKVGLLCSQADPKSRPSMGLVVRMLAGDITVPPISPCSSSIDDFFTRNSCDTSTSSRGGLIELASRNIADSTRASSATSSSKNTSSNSNSLISRENTSSNSNSLISRENTSSNSNSLISRADSIW